MAEPSLYNSHTISVWCAVAKSRAPPALLSCSTIPPPPRQSKFVVAHRLRAFCRRLFAVASILSLLLCLGAIALWVRSYWVMDMLSRFDAGRRGAFIITSNMGSMDVYSHKPDSPSDSV